MDPFRIPRRKTKPKPAPAPAPPLDPSDDSPDYDSVISPDIGPFPWTPAIDPDELYEFHRTFVTAEEGNAAEKALKAADEARFRITRREIEKLGVQPVVEVLAESLALKGKAGNKEEEGKIEGEEYPKKREERDFFARISTGPELVIEIAKWMDPKGLLSLYCVHRDVNEIINGHLSHAMRLCSLQQAPEAVRIYPFTLYGNLCIPDPVGRPHPSRAEEVRKVPSLRWLQMIVHREKTVRDILACMARQGHRTPSGMALSLLKMWLIMDIATTAQRVQVMHSSFFSAMDLWNIQCFVVKLDMRFNDPIDGPGESHLRGLILGQKGLTPLCRMLKRIEYTGLHEVIRLAVRYNWVVKPEHRLLPMFGIPAEEIGVGHLEGWGKGRIHLLRPDELVVREAVRRKLDLKNHIMGMMLWGYVDPLTGENTKPTEEEMYMSDDGESERPKHPWKQDYEWLEQEEKVFEESEELKESNDWSYRMKKEEMRKEGRRLAEMAMRTEEQRMAEEAMRAEEARMVEQASRMEV